MAQRTVVTLVDDLSGEEAEGVRTREIWVDGVGYEIDLDEDNSQLLDDSLQDFLEAARKLPKRAAPSGVRVGRKTPTGSGPARRDPEQTKGIRAWAKDNGYEVSERGRIPANVEEAYQTNTPNPNRGGTDAAEAESGAYLTAVG